MKSLIKGFFTAFSMYSTIPMPESQWDKSSMKYAMCFFPLVGGVIGSLVYCWNIICVALGLSGFMFSVGMVVLPLLISGGIHLDGLIDTSDALYSRREIEKKLEILKDPHVGAFGVIMCVTYLIIQFGASGQLYENTSFLYLVICGYILSRTFTTLSIVSCKTAKNTGLAHIFSSTADKRTVKVVMIIYLLILFGLLMYMNLFIAGISIAVSIAWFLLHKRICYKEFGGITGDLAGYFLQGLELLFLLVAMIGGIL